MCWFLDAGMMRCLAPGVRRPASKKRQGTKSREVRRRQCRERFEDSIFAPALMVGPVPAQGDLYECAQAWKVQ
jgi:hypothetical protein